MAPAFFRAVQWRDLTESTERGCWKLLVLVNEEVGGSDLSKSNVLPIRSTVYSLDDYS